MLADALILQHTKQAYMNKTLKDQSSSRTQSRRKWAPVSTAARQEAKELREQRQACQQEIEDVQQKTRQSTLAIKDCICTPNLCA